MEKADVYRITDALDGTSLEAMAARLEVRGKHPHFMAMLDEYLDAMQIDSARGVLDLGCGTGVASRAVLRRPRFAGAVPQLLREAGLHLEASFAHVLADIGSADFFSATIPSFVAAQAGDERGAAAPGRNPCCALRQGVLRRSNFAGAPASSARYADRLMHTTARRPASPAAPAAPHRRRLERHHHHRPVAEQPAQGGGRVRGEQHRRPRAQRHHHARARAG
jgi:hypothetical protein